MNRIAAAGPYTLLEQLNNSLHKGELEDEHYLSLIGHGWGHTQGVDYIYGRAGGDIASALIGFEAGRKTKEDTITTIRRDIVQALRDNEPFRGLRAEERATHDIWMNLMDKGRAAGEKTAGAGLSDKQIYERIHRGLVRMEQIIKQEFPSSTLRYGNRELNGTVNGHNVKIFYRIIRASNGEVAGLPVIVVDGHKYDEFNGYFTEKTITDKLGELLETTSRAASASARISGKLNFNTPGKFVNYLMNTLIPDLRASGTIETAKDFATAARLIMTGRQDNSFISYLSRTLVPDLRESGKDATADDFLEAAYWISKGGMRGASVNREAVAAELVKIAESLAATTGTFKCPNCGTKVLENTGYCIKCKKNVKKAAWETLPRGWTEESLKSFYHNLAGGGDAKKKFYHCVSEIKKTDVTNPESFCGSLFDHVRGDTSWRGVGR